MDSIEVTAQAPDTEQATVKGLAWKLLYANHRPSLGPERWDALRGQAGGPEDIKALPLDANLPLDAFEAALWALDAEMGDGDGATLASIVHAMVERWSTMYQRFTEHLEHRPAEMIDLLCTEIHPWFFPHTTPVVLDQREHAVLVELDEPQPDAFRKAWLEAFTELTHVNATVTPIEADRFLIEWDPPKAEQPALPSLLFEATRARFLPATIGPVFVGTALAAWQGTFNTLTAILALIAAACLHLAFNLLNDVLDHRSGIDPANLTPTPFSGGSRVIQRGLMGSNAMLATATTLGLLGIGLGLLLLPEAGGPLLALGALGVGLGYAYSAKPFRLANRGLGEATAGLVFGPLLTAGAATVQTGALSLEAALAGVPLGLSMAAFLMLTELPDAPWDARTGRRTLIVRLGDHAPTATGLAFLTPYPVLAGLAWTSTLPVASLIGLALVPFALLIAHRVHQMMPEDTDTAANLQTFAMILHATLGGLITAGLAWGVFS